MKTNKTVPEKITFNSSQNTEHSNAGSKFGATNNTKISNLDQVLRSLPLTINTKRGA